MTSRIYLCTNMENVELLDRAMQNYADLFNGINSAPVVFSTDRPDFEMGVKKPHLNGNSDYQIYIGKEIEQRKEYAHGLELPLEVLENENSFKEVVGAIRSRIGRLENIG